METEVICMSTKEAAMEILNCMTEQQLQEFVNLFRSIMEIPNEETRAVLEDVKQGKNLVGSFSSVKELMEDLDAED